MTLALAMGAGLTAGCGGYGTICQDEMDCRGGNDADIDACIDGRNAGEDLASAEDCSKQYDDVITCEEDSGRCRNGKSWEYDCDSEHQRLNDCMKGVFNFQ